MTGRPADRGPSGAEKYEEVVGAAKIVISRVQYGLGSFREVGYFVVREFE